MANNRHPQPGPFFPSLSRSRPSPWERKRGSKRILFRRSESGRKYNKLMIVAHPDDETIFGGATLLRSRRWKVICVTNGDHPTRRKEFKKAMRKARVKWEIWNYKDKRYGSFNIKRLKADLKKAIRKKRINKFVTHSRTGEYGHSQHKALSKLVHKIVKKNLYVFHLSKKKLKKKVLNNKKRLLKCYKSQKTVIRKLKHYVKRESIKKVK